MSFRSLRPAPALGALLLLVAAPALAQGPERIVKEKRADGGLILDESGLTRNFEKMNEMIRSIDRRTLAGHEVEVHSGRLPVQSTDYRRFQDLESGLVEFQHAAAIRLRTDVTLDFDGVRAEPGNVAEGYPGVYSLWLHKAGPEDWRLIVNAEPDVWGTMHSRSADLGEVRLGHELGSDGDTALEIRLEPEGDGGTLRLAWGPHRWSAPFTVGSADGR